MKSKLVICSLLASSLNFGQVVIAQDTECASRLSAAAFEKANQIFDRADNVHYEHAKLPAGEQVQFSDSGCVARTDCSGFISYILHEVSPRHYDELRQAQIGRRYPQAAAFEKFFASLSEAPRPGWLRVNNVRNLRAGDIIAWAKPAPTEPLAPGQKKGNSGHVMFVAAAPSEIENAVVDGKQIRFMPVSVLDSSSVRHFPPEQLPPHAHQTARDGLGKGVIRLVIDDHDQPCGYWEGTYWAEGQKDLKRPTFTREIAFGRLVPFSDR